MAALTSEQRNELRQRFESDQSRVHAPIPIGSGTVRLAFDAIDDYFDAHAAEINNALPEPAKSGLTVEQKALIVIAVIRKRYGGG